MRQETGYLATLRQQTANALEWPLSCTELVQRCTDLIDELQRERGLGQLVLSSVGESYAAALREQLRLSDEAEQAMRSQLLRLAARPAMANPAQAELVRLGLALLNSPGLADLLPMRRGMLLLRCTRQQMFDAYCALLAQLLELVEAAAQAMPEPALRQELATLLQLMWGKEYSGQERASGAGLFASGCHDARVWQRITRLIEAQHRCASAFISQARPGARKRLSDSLQHETQADERKRHHGERDPKIQRMRRQRHTQTQSEPELQRPGGKRLPVRIALSQQAHSSIGNSLGILDVEPLIVEAYKYLDAQI